MPASRRQFLSCHSMHMQTWLVKKQEPHRDKDDVCLGGQLSQKMN